MGSNPADGIDFRLVVDVWCVGSGLCDQLITRSEDSYRVCVYVIWERRTMTRSGPKLGACVTVAAADKRVKDDTINF